MVLVNVQETDGGVVRRRFRSGGRQWLANDELTAAEVNSIPQANRNALVSGGFLHVYPKKRAGGSSAPPDRHVVNRGFGKFDVVEGTKINDKPLSKEQADKLAHNLDFLKKGAADAGDAEDD